MFKAKKKLLGIVLGISVMALTLGFTGTAEAAVSTLSVQFKNLIILFNGQQATLGAQPLIVNGSTYLPVRAMAVLFNKNIEWNATTQTISISDKAGENVTQLKAQVATLTTQVASLQAQLAAKTSSSGRDLNDIEDDLNDDNDFTEYEDLEWSFNLSGDEDDVKITIEIDLGDSDLEDGYNDLSDSDLEDLVQDVVDEILDEEDYEDADITAEIEDSDSGDTLAEFEVSSSGSVSIVSSGDIDDLEDQLNDDHTDLGDIDELYITLRGDEDDIDFTVEINYTLFNDEWDALTDTQIKSFMEAIQDDIEDYYDGVDADGAIVDTSDDDALMTTYNSSNAFTRPSPY